MRAFVTGATGFVGGWLLAHLQDMGDEVLTLSPEVDLGERGAIGARISSAEPDVIYHLAALTHVGRSWEDPRETFRVNVLGTVELFEAVRAMTRPARVLLVSSSEVYGRGAGKALSEDAPLAPISPYAASKVAAEYLGVQAHLGRGLEVVRVRPFNHVGPGQSDAFVVSALARRVVEAELSGAGEIVVGDLSAARDFTDVRDVVRAYRVLIGAGEAGEVYNVCSGISTTIAQVLDELVRASGVEITTRVEESLLRPVDLPYLVGDGSRLQALTGWLAEIPLRQTLSEVLEDWRVRLKPSSGSLK